MEVIVHKADEPAKMPESFNEMEPGTAYLNEGSPQWRIYLGSQMVELRDQDARVYAYLTCAGKELGLTLGVNPKRIAAIGRVEIHVFPMK